MSFQDDIKRFNKMYKLPVSPVPSLARLGESAYDRLMKFKSIILEEVTEIDVILQQLSNSETSVSDMEILTNIADLLGDLQVYCASEMAKFGIPLNRVLSAIMESNFSKLGVDGQPIYDERGKVQKGPNYYKPEPLIQQILQEEIPFSVKDVFTTVIGSDSVKTLGQNDASVILKKHTDLLTTKMGE